MIKLGTIKALLAFLICSTLVTQSLNAQLQANFTATPVSGCSPLLVNFTNTSTGTPVSYQWDLGNGTQSTLPNPSATYFTPGNYSVSLIVTNSSGISDTLVQTNLVKVNPKPVVNFVASDTIGCYPLQVQFTDLSTIATGTNNQWLWDFGDGSSSTQQNPSHTFSQGNYTVVLQVISDSGCSSLLVKPFYVKANNGIQSSFTFSPSSSCTFPINVQFTNTTTGTGVLSYSWNFGDGGTSTLQNPAHSYTTNGLFNVTLTTTNNQGCTNTYTYNNAINIGNYNASFTSNDNVCVNSPIVFTNTSTPATNNVLWSFGDGTFSNQPVATKIYSAPGNYIVKLVADYGACKDSTTKLIVVLPKPVSNFTANQTSSCTAPLTVNFNNTSTVAASFQWNFGDGGTSTTQNPTHTYTATGSYSVSLITTNSVGCSDTLTRTNYIIIQEPTVSFTNLPDSGCRALTISPAYTINSIDGIASYNWNFGDGFTSTAANPIHTYTASGTYTITLTITTNGGCTKTISSTVKVSEKPNANFAVNPNITCAYIPVNFTNTSTGNINFTYWQFGEGGTSYATNPTYSYQDTGYFSVTLIVGNSGCYDTLRIDSIIYVKPPIAKFTPVLNCENPLQWNFTDNSVAPLTWAWTFGDGNVSSTQNPTHTYANPGLYDVGLTVTNGSCTHSISQQIHVINEQPNFRASDTVICRNSNVTFTSFGYNRSNINGFTWNFGDGTIIAGDSISNHIYTQSGTYTVSLITTDLNGCRDTVTRNLYIKVHGPIADFNTASNGVCINAAVQFNDLTTTDGLHPIQLWQWNWGDGNSQNFTAPPFSHTYTANGTFSVSLKVTDSYGCTDSIHKPNALIIAQPLSSFTSADTLTCPNSNVQFTNTSSGSNLSYNWSFGDGINSSQQNPIHQYTADGFYTVSLTVTDQYGCVNTFVKPQFIHVASPRSFFSASDTFSTCPPLFVQFNNLSQNYTSIQWDFGDNSYSTSNNPTHFYTQPGTFIAKLTVTSVGGCQDEYSKIIRIQGPSGTFSYTPLIGCSPLQVSFNTVAQNATSYVFDFNNGQTVSTTSTNITYTFTQQGKYLPRVILKDNQGCDIPILGLDTIRVFGVNGTVNVNKTLLCDSGFISFTSDAISNDAITNYSWNFGDGNTATGQSTTHHYTSPGNYNVNCYVATAFGCIDTIPLSVPINIVESPIIDFTSNNGACIPATATFTPQIIRTDTSTLSWNWSFGNGQSSNQMNPGPVVYSNSGNYQVSVIVLNSNGCTDTSTHTFNAFPLPVVDAGNNVQICRNAPTMLTATGALTYNWSPAFNLSCTNCVSTNANPDTTHTYYVEGTDANGCKNRDSVTVRVIQRFNMSNSPDVAYCAGGTATLFANGANSYLWSPSGSLSSTTGSSVTAQPVATTTYTVVGYDAYNCFTDTARITVSVHPKPVVNAGPDVTISGGSSTQLQATANLANLSYTWNNIISLSCANCPNPIAKPPKQTTYRVEAITQNGCKGSDEVTVFVTCENGNLFVPNTFSPNGDGMNDILYPRGNGIHIIKTFKIYNRWGELVYEQNGFNANDPNKGWNGSYKGKQLTADVYIYYIETICENGNPIGFKGNVTLVQ